MAQADAVVEDYEVYQWLAKTVLMSDASQVNEDGEAIGSWKKNPNFKPVPKDILFDLNRGGDFAKDYPLSWAFRTGKGCAMGKAITPYADARVGETIQGVAMDVKNIRVGADINEFLNGDVKKQQKTLESARKKQKQQNLIGGMRYQSTSDFRYEFGSDYLMTFFEMQALGANVQLYTKVIEAVDFLASTGADCNLSVMPLGDGYVIDPKTGKKKLVFSNVTGINARHPLPRVRPVCPPGPDSYGSAGRTPRRHPGAGLHQRSERSRLPEADRRTEGHVGSSCGYHHGQMLGRSDH